MRGLNNRQDIQIIDTETGQTDVLLSVSYICSFVEGKAQMEISCVYVCSRDLSLASNGGNA